MVNVDRDVQCNVHMVDTTKRGALITLVLIKNSAHNVMQQSFQSETTAISRLLKLAPSIRHTHSNHSIVHMSLLASFVPF